MNKKKLAEDFEKQKNWNGYISNKYSKPFNEGGEKKKESQVNSNRI